MSTQSLSSDYPLYYSSLQNLISNVENHIEK